jgi:hypothetical protein
MSPDNWIRRRFDDDFMTKFLMDGILTKRPFFSEMNICFIVATLVDQRKANKQHGSDSEAFI